MSEMNSQNFFIAPATPQDIPAILALIHELADYEKLSHEVTATAELLEDHMFGAIPKAHALVARLEGEIIGYALYFYNFSTFLAKPGIYLEDLYVQPHHRGQGYGKTLLIHLARMAHQQGCGRLEWSVLDWNQPSIDFYKSLGAVPMDEWTIFRVTGDALEKLSTTDT